MFVACFNVCRSGLSVARRAVLFEMNGVFIHLPPSPALPHKSDYAGSIRNFMRGAEKVLFILVR